MLYSITHTTELNYSQPIAESVMEMRAMPRTNERQVLRQFGLTVTPSAKASHHEDWLGNTVHQFSVLGTHAQVVVTARSLVETRRGDWDLTQLGAPLDGLIRDHRSWDFLQHHGPVMHDPALAPLTQRLGLDAVRRVGQAIQIVLQRTRDVISYRKGVTTSASTVGEVLKLGAGVCQDFAHLGLSLLRHVGVPCRYVSGYLHRENEPELETHAWLEVFVPGVGWIGLDPTHGVMVSEDYVAVAVGRSYADVPPNRGVYRGAASEKIRVRVAMQQVEEFARLTPYSTTMERPRRRVETNVPSAVPSVGFGLGLEQQRARPNAVGLVVQQQRQQQQ